MVELAIADEPAFVLSRVELDRAGPSYAVDTPTRCAPQPPAPDASPDELTWIMSARGAPGPADLARSAATPRLVRVAAAPRQGGPHPGSRLAGGALPRPGGSLHASSMDRSSATRRSTIRRLVGARSVDPLPRAAARSRRTSATMTSIPPSCGARTDHADHDPSCADRTWSQRMTGVGRPGGPV